jgi:YaiO family outer membrane protein
VRRFAIAAMVACAAGAQAGEPRPHPWDLRVDGVHDNLDNGYDDWRELMAQLAWRPDTRTSLFGSYRETERFDLRDREAAAGAYLPLGGGGAVLHGEGSWSKTHHVLARHAYLLELAQPLGQGWVLTGGGRQARYETGDVQATWLQVEKYVGDYRFAWHAQVSRVESSGWSPAHRLSASWYRGELTFATLTLARGREVENVPPSGLLQTDVRAASLSGSLELVPRWALTGELAWTEQGELYTRRTARLGTRLLF